MNTGVVVTWDGLTNIARHRRAEDDRPADVGLAASNIAGTDNQGSPDGHKEPRPGCSRRRGLFNF
ncbi:MAG: hypothetical protein ACXW2D_15370 [Burkholderiaceae bacterium]